MLKQISHLRKHIQIISLTAKPTGGKTLKGRVLAAMGDEFGIARITTSAMMEWNIQHKTALGVEYEKHLDGMRSRQLVPCHLVLPGLADAIIRTHEQGYTTIIVDGAPRNIVQAKALLSCRVPFKLFEFDISDDEAIRRDTNRRTVEKRVDDGQIQEGLNVYASETSPGIRFIKKAGLHEPIDGTESIRSQVSKVLRKIPGFRSFQFTAMMKKLDDTNHAARILIDEAEGRRRKETSTRLPQPHWQQRQSAFATA